MQVYTQMCAYINYCVCAYHCHCCKEVILASNCVALACWCSQYCYQGYQCHYSDLFQSLSSDPHYVYVHEKAKNAIIINSRRNVHLLRPYTPLKTKGGEYLVSLVTVYVLDKLLVILMSKIESYNYVWMHGGSLMAHYDICQPLVMSGGIVSSRPNGNCMMYMVFRASLYTAPQMKTNNHVGNVYYDFSRRSSLCDSLMILLQLYNQDQNHIILMWLMYIVLW